MTVHIYISLQKIGNYFGVHGYLSCNIAVFVTTTSQDVVCKISIRNDVCVSQITMMLPVIILHLTEEIIIIMFHISFEYQDRL